MVLEVDLDNLVAQTEHDRVLRSHPLLHIDRARRWLVCRTTGFVACILISELVRSTLLGSARLEVRLEMLQKCYLLLQFLRVLSQWVLR